MNTTFHFDDWKRFVNEGILDSARLNKRLLESWYRCKKAMVNPYLNKGLDLLSKEELSEKKEKNSLLIELASPYIKRMDQAIKDSGMMALLVDPDGYVLSLTGNETTLSEARNINFIEGVRWTECEVGTNAIGTSLESKEAVTINGAEHYSVASHQWSCSATPILYDNDNLLGVIDVSCPIKSSHPFMLGMVASISYAIEKDISKRSYQEEIALVQQADHLAETHQNRLFLVCNQKQTVISASKPVRERFPQSIGMFLDEVLHNGYQIVSELPFHSKKNNRIVGSCYFLSEMQQSRQNISLHSLSHSKPFIFKGERGTSEVFQNTLKKVKLVAPTDTTVFISGETGSGKELIARAIHDNSPRKDGPFIALNCGAIPKDLMESELFGYVEGAFTGARRKGYKGKFEQAQQGTLFLDEIGEIPHSMQVALLRVLQERKVTPVGSTKEIPLNVRVITATHRDIMEHIKKGNFREDLFYRLNVYPIDVPPLRNRKEDIPYLIRYFCKRKEWNNFNVDDLSDRLKDYEWPGNIRELINVLERLHIMSLDNQSSQDLIVNSMESLTFKQPSSSSLIGQKDKEAVETKLTAREKIQRDFMLDALKKTKGNVTAAAKLLEIPRSTFYKRLRKFGI
ncbi:sigma-54-dependent Fis family transcriptional regulator [Pullulanibacillus sp. KACC 23026]|uniref:sigma-54-dependent Fis family transcriptional regulator n=1 Tax=Pullulanibacillus sp. KACC 23026 TaxID=3028315 RepID=UPI0023B0DD5D|nr:sigma-54-dependent Fis family transcriptional regulator [Pullulanibacillus sp. KACC 23026]WEG10758.1 sigma-54-dependent Fis family transcriptional regulator [Pullulanibacillus sp. KACC 23026]